jgi:hypothetical protein
MPRFVVLRHETPRGHERPTHWDFMLECDGVLRTWALADPPSLGCSTAAEALPDHRLAYLDYEGEVSGGRGWVTRWDAGTYELVGGHSPGEITADTLRLVMQGAKMTGEVLLTAESPQVPRDQGADAPRSPTSSNAGARYWSFSWNGN